MKNNLFTLSLFSYLSYKKKSKNPLKFLLISVLLFLYTSAVAQTIPHPFPASGTLVVPAGIDKVTVEGWGAGGAGGAATATITVGRSGGGGGGGGYAKADIATATPQTLTVNVGGTTIGTNGNGGNGGATFVTGYNVSFYAPGGAGGIANVGSGAGGGNGGTATVGNLATSPGIGGTAGSSALLGVLFSSGAGGNAGNTAGGGGIGGATFTSVAIANSPGNNGAEYGGGGGGGLSSLLATQNGGNGARGHAILTYTCKTYSLTGIAAANVCTATGTTSLVQLTGTTASLPMGNYTVTYSTTNPSSSGLTASMTVSTAGSGSFTATGLNIVGSSTITVNSLTSVDCVSAISTNNQVAITVSGQPTIALGSTTAVCNSAASQNTNLTYGTTTNLPVKYGITWNATPANSFVAVTNATLNPGLISIAIPAGTAAGTYTGNLTVQNAVGCTSISYPFNVVINSSPTAPTASATQQPSCENNTGTITITSPAPGTGFSYSINGVDYSNTSGIFTGLSAGGYTVKVKNTASGCESPATPVAINPLITKTWNGNTDANWTNAANWTPAGMPLPTDCVNIPDRPNDPVISGTNGSFFANRLNIESTGSLIVESSNTLTVTNEVNVIGSGILKFENNSSLVQVSNAANSGNIIYKRNTKPIKRFDITYWSSPITRVPAYTLHDLSPETLYDKYFKYDRISGWITIVSGMEEMLKGNGYNIRGPQTYNNDFGQIYYGEFIGVPNNGNIQGPPASPENFNLLGNPYPSAIYADQFIYDNRDNMYGTLYFWTSNTLPAIVTPGTNTYTYNSNDYAYYNLSGAVNVGTLTGTGATSPGNQTAPAGYIAAGQGFFAKARTNQSVVFTNSMRVANRNAQFFKTSSATAGIEKHRVWLNLTNTEGAFKQLLIGYITGATNSWDNNYDAVTMSANPYIDFYSINDGKKLVIQGRAIPFVVSDTIPLGYKSALEGNFTIAIDQTDGNLTAQNIYLQDKVTNTIHNLKSGGYTFSTTIGVFPERFVLRYANSGAVLGTDEFNSIDQNVVVSVKDKNIKIQSFKDQEMIRETAIYDAGGSLLYQKNQIDETVWNISNFQSGPQVLLIKITLDNGRTVTKKIIFK